MAQSYDQLDGATFAVLAVTSRAHQPAEETSVRTEGLEHCVGRDRAGPQETEIIKLRRKAHAAKSCKQGEQNP